MILASTRRAYCARCWRRCTRPRLVKLGAATEAGQAVEEREALAGWAASLSYASLHRLWQLLLKGHDEVARAALPIEACEMALLRLIHASTLPDPGELARMIANGASAPVAPPAAASPPPPAATGAPAQSDLPSSFTALVALFESNGEHALAAQLTNSARVIRYAPPELVLSAARPLPVDLVRDLTAQAKRITDRVWRISTEDAPGAPTLREEREAARNAERQAILDTPVVKAAFEAFPDAELESWTTSGPAGAKRSMES